MTAPLTREQQIKFIQEASERRAAAIKRWEEYTQLQDALAKGRELVRAMKKGEQK